MPQAGTPHQLSFSDFKLITLSKHLSPENPIRSTEFLRGRTNELNSLERELRFFKAIPFVFGSRGVGKTSLARTVAQQITPADREHIYVACAPHSKMLEILQEIALDLLKLALRMGNIPDLARKLEFNVALNPGIKLTLEKRTPQLEAFPNVNVAVRTLRDIDLLLSDASKTVVIIDELEELSEEDRRDLAFLVKQLGDQEFSTRFVLVGIAENVEELIGVHPSVARYIKEVSLDPLPLHTLMDIVRGAAKEVDVQIDEDLLIRIGVIGNGYPHFAHLMGKMILTEAIVAGSTHVTPDIYARGVGAAVEGSIQELKVSYEKATQRRDKLAQHLLWTLANTDLVDLMIEDWIRDYRELAARGWWIESDESKVRIIISRLSGAAHGRIIKNTPIRYGDTTTRYRYKRFSNNLMKGHVRLQAEKLHRPLGRPNL